MVRSLSLFAVGALVGGLVVSQLSARGQLPAPGSPQTSSQEVDITALAADVARLKTVTPTLSHVMADAAFQYSNLWFAGQEQNWPLAAFYYNETRGRIRWFLRLNPTAKTPDGEVVDMASFFEAVDTSSLAAVKKAIDQKDRTAFGAAYKVMLESCYSCHKSAGRPYLRPMVPTVQPQTIINYSPAASWP